MKTDESLEENGKMEKITKEELLAKLGGKALSDDELEKVAGGNSYDACFEAAYNELMACSDAISLNTQDNFQQCSQAFDMKMALLSSTGTC